MSYSGNGTFLINSAGQPVVPGTTITTTAFNALTADLASGLTTAMTKDGQTVPTANIPMGGFKLTGLGAGTSATDAAQFGQLQNAPVATLITVAGADTITGTLVQTLTAYATGQQFSFVAAGTNTTAVTLNIDGLGAKAVTRTGAVALAAGALVSGQMAIVEYDGTRFQLINANAFTNLTVSGALTVGTTLAVTGVATLTAQPILSSLTASLPVFTDASKGLVSNTMTGTGSVMMSASPTTTGTLTAAAINASGLVAMAGAATVGTTLGVTGTSTMAAINASGSVTLSGSSFFRSPTTSNTPGTFNFYLAASGIREGTAGDFNIDTYNGGWGARLTVSQAGAVTINGTSAGNMLKIVASASGTRGDATYQSWYRANGTTRKGYFGFAGADTADITLATEEAGGTLQFSTAGAQVGQFTAGGYLKASPDPAILFNATAAYHEFIGNSASVGALRIRSQNASFAGTAALVYVDRAASTLFNLLDMQSGGSNKFLVDGTGNTTISGTVQPTLSLAKTNATATTWQIYNNGNLQFYDGTNTPLYFTGANSTFGGTLVVGTATQSSAIEGQIQGSDTNHSAIFAKNNYAGSAGMATFHSSLGNGTNSVANTNCYHLIAVSQGSATYYLYGNGTTSFTSDERLKKNIETTRNGYVDDLCKLRVVKYQWKSEPDEGGKELGLIAQEVEKVFPGLVQDAAEEMNGFTPKVLKASVLPFMLLKAIQEQQIIITALTNRITALEAAR